ncbi:MAG: hypothetical protein ABR543_02640 [Gemmatimonadaceae bacterium]
MKSTLSRSCVLWTLLLLLPVAAMSQEQKAKPSIDFSGVLYANFRYETALAERDQNRFDLDRAYLTVRAPVSERVTVRLTTDIFQQRSSGPDSYYRGWTVRAKYAYLQYDFLKPGSSAYGTGAYARVGMLNTIFIEHVEQFWPRWLGNTATERFGFFSSADMGLAGQLTLPRKLGEVYATITNGPGYTSREIDRYKDYAARISITPLASSNTVAKTLTLSLWGYKGATAVTGGSGGVPDPPPDRSLRRDRWGVFAGLRDPRLVLGADYGGRAEERLDIPPGAGGREQFSDSTGRLLSGFVLANPFKLMRPASPVPLRVVFRLDNFKPNQDGDASVRFIVAGLIWDVGDRASFALDYQEQLPRDGAALSTAKTYFMHLVANF